MNGSFFLKTLKEDHMETQHDYEDLRAEFERMILLCESEEGKALFRAAIEFCKRKREDEINMMFASLQEHRKDEGPRF